MFYVEHTKLKLQEVPNKEFDSSLRRVFPLRAYQSFPQANYWNKDEPFLHSCYFVHVYGCGPSGLDGWIFLIP